MYMYMCLHYMYMYYNALPLLHIYVCTCTCVYITCTCTIMLYLYYTCTLSLHIINHTCMFYIGYSFFSALLTSVLSNHLAWMYTVSKNGSATSRHHDKMASKSVS